MELNEALLVVAALVIIIFGQIYLQKLLSPKGSFITTCICFVVLNAMFIEILIERFNLLMLFLAIIVFISSVYTLNKRYKEYKAQAAVNNQDSGS